MCYTAKASLLSLVLLVVISILLIWRNEKYDWVAGVLFLAVSLIQLVEYLRHRDIISSAEAGRDIFLVLWFQILVLTTATYFYLRTSFTLICMLIAVGLFIWALLYHPAGGWSMTVGPSGHMEWQQSGGAILGSMSLVYLAGLFIPLFAIQASLGWKDIGLWAIIIVLALTCVWANIYFPGAPFGSLWCYSAILVAFTAWLAGAFSS